MSHAHGPRSRECREMFGRLSEYLDEELSQAQCDELAEHMEDCPPCEAFLESLRRTIRLTESLPPDRLPDAVRSSVREAWRRLQADRGQ